MKNLRKFEMKRNTMTKGGELEGGRRERSPVRMRAGVINEMITMLVMIAIQLSQMGVNGFIIWKETIMYNERRPENGKVAESVEIFGVQELNNLGVEFKKKKIF